MVRGIRYDSPETVIAFSDSGGGTPPFSVAHFTMWFHRMQLWSDTRGEHFEKM